MNDTVKIVEVGPRDGLQNETEFLPTKAKVKLIDLLSQAGFSTIEATSFVSPKWVPQLADAYQVMQAINRYQTTRYAALTPNLKGFEKALEAKVDEVAIFASASERFSQHNINCSIQESLERFAPVLKAAKAVNMPVRGYVSCVISCPYEGSVAPANVVSLSSSLLEMGCYEVSLGDTIGAGTPNEMHHLFDALIPTIPADKVAGHFHDTNGHALQNVEVALDYGIRCFDSAVAGLGGCPYAPGAKGNLSSLMLVDRLHALGYRTPINRDKLMIAQNYIQAQFSCDQRGSLS